jgi:hypothetical protein
LVIAGDNKVKIVTLPALSNITGGSLLWGDFDEYVLFSALKRDGEALFILKTCRKKYIDTNFARIHLPSLKTIGYLQVQSTGNLDCKALGANLSSLTFTPKQFDVGVGFTCWTPYESNRYNSSDHSQSSTSGSTSSPSSAGTSQTSSPKYALIGNPLSTQFLVY